MPHNTVSITSKENEITSALLLPPHYILVDHLVVHDLTYGRRIKIMVAVLIFGQVGRV